MATIKYDYYTTGEIGQVDTGNVRWAAQTFTVTETFVIQSIKLKLRRSAAAPGTVTVSLRNTAANKPTGVDLIYGTTDGNTLTDDAAGEWRTITFNTQRELPAGSVFAIVLRCAGASVAPYPLAWRSNNDSDYPGGRYCYSADSGVSWTLYHDTPNATDFMFECWGDGDLVLAPTSGTTIRRLVVFASNKAYYEDE